MAHYATLNEYRFVADEEDIRGAKLFGEGSQELGHIRDVLFDHATGDIRYLVVEYGHDRRVLVPVDQVFRAVTDEDSFSSELSCDELDHLPAFDENLLKNDRQWRDYEELYRSTMEDRKPSPPMEKEPSNVTPMDLPRRNDYVPDVWPQRLAPIFGSTRNDSEKLEMAPRTRGWQTENLMARLGPRWNQFAGQVRRDLHAIRGKCERCEEKDTRAA